MRIAHVSPLLVAAALLAGCAGTAPSAPLSEAALAVTMPADFSAGVYTFNPGIQTLSIDPVNLTATVAPKTRYAAFNGDLFYLQLNQFSGGFPVGVSGITIQGGNLLLTLDVKHPFAAPTTLEGNPTATKRLDLGLSGRICFLLGVDTTTMSSDPMDPDYVGDYEFTFSGGPVRMQTGILLNAAGYYSPAGMVPIADRPAGNATHFPFMQMVDEMVDLGSGVVGSRVGISNGGSSHGNYDPDEGGWQNNTLGPNFTGWTGYGVLHQGQTSRQVAVFDLASLGGGLDLDFSVIATYVDPRQGSSASILRANRLPRDNNPQVMAYREPHGAVDLERVTIPALQWSPTSVAETVQLEIIDQDDMAPADPEFPDQLAQDLGSIPFPSGILGGFASSSELGIASEAGLNLLGEGSGEDPVGFFFTLDNTATSDGGFDGRAKLCFQIVDSQIQNEDGLTLNNNNPPTPVTAGQEQACIVYAVGDVEIIP